MKEIKKILYICLFTLIVNISAYTQDQPYCTNLGFELGNFTNWVGHSWIYSISEPQYNTSKVPGILTRRHTIISDTTAYDANTGYALKMVPKGYKYSARLGDAIMSPDAGFRCWNQSLKYTMTIDSSNALLVMKFACILEYAAEHNATNEPRFRLMLYDAKGNVIPDCSNYDVYASNNYVKGFNTFVPTTPKTPRSGISPIRWRDWTTVGANLSKYYGQTITVEFTTADCAQHFHYGYAYFVASCQPLYITINYCSDDSVAKLTAPIGFEKYKWTNSSGKVIDTTEIIKVSKPNEGEIYSCTMTSATGCVVTLQSIIQKYILYTNFDSRMIDCKSNKVQFFNLTTVTHGTMLYKWDFGDGTTSSQKNPLHTFPTSGLHPMQIITKNPPSTCVDTIKKIVESFSPPLVGIRGDTTYCPNLGVILKAYGAYRYNWSNGSTAESIEVKAPGGKYWLLGHSSTGCVSDTIKRNIIEDPYWELCNNSDTTLCKGQSSVLSVSGAIKYLWNNGNTTNSITVSSPGDYNVTGTNKRGCNKSKFFHVNEYPIPEVGITTSVNTLDKKHNRIICTSPDKPGIAYFWDMGDNSTQTGSSVDYSYYITNENLDYTITQKALSLYGCADSVSKVIDVIPFIPNVFSPNGDGINDLFMQGIELQVFDRNGFTIYEGSDGWNGKYKGQLLDPDTYFYLVRYLNRKKEEQVKKGYVTLVR